MSRLLTLLVTVTLMAGACSQPDPPKRVHIDHLVGKTGRTGVSGAGPALGLLQADWQVEVDVSAATVDFQVEGGSLLAFSTDGVQAFDATTGERVWHYREPGRRVEWSEQTGGSVLLRTTGGVDRLIALDSATGRLLWERTPEPYTSYTAGRGVVVRSTLTQAFTGIDARTGEDLWDRKPDVGEGCTAHLPTGVSGDGSVVVLAEECSGRTTRLDGLDPTSGDLLWSHERPIGELTPGMISVAGGSAVLAPSKPKGVTVFSRDRVRQIALSLGGCDPCRPVVAGDQIAWQLEDEAQQQRVSIINVRTGATTVVESMAPQSDLISDGHRLYGLRQGLAGHVEGTPRYWATVIDPLAGSSRALPVHAQPDYGFLHLVGTAGDRLIMVERRHEKAARFRLTAYGSIPVAEPLEYGGADPRSWPDCAQLLAAVPGKRLPGSPDTKRRADGGLFEGAALVTSTCRAGIDGIGDVGVTVLWVTRRPQDADLLLDGRPGAPPDADEIAGKSIRVGRVIVRVRGSDEAERAVVERLRSMATAEGSS